MSRYGTRIRTQNDLRTHPPPGAGVRGRRARTPDLCLLDSSLQTARLATDRDGNATDHTNKIERIRKISGARHGILSRTAGDRARAKCRDQDTVRNGGGSEQIQLHHKKRKEDRGGGQHNGTIRKGVCCCGVAHRKDYQERMQHALTRHTIASSLQRPGSQRIRGQNGPQKEYKGEWQHDRTTRKGEC